jgi:hypothetical protein
MPENQEKWSERLRQRLDDLHARAHIQERPFTSDKPIVGRLIVFIRETWNSIAARWYVRPMLHQQNLFNQTVTQMAQELLETVRVLQQTQADLASQLEELDQRVIGGDRDITLLARKIAEGEYRLRKWEERASRERTELAHNLSRLEEMLSQGEGEQKAG